MVNYWDCNHGILVITKKAPRFQFLSCQKTHLFNMPLLNKLVVDNELYLTEGVTDCLAMLSSGKAAVAIPSATIIPENDLSLLDGYKLKMMPDNDEAGWDGFMKLRLALAKRESAYLKKIFLPSTRIMVNGTRQILRIEI